MGRIVFGLGGLAVFALLPFGSQIAEVATQTDKNATKQIVAPRHLEQR